MGDGNEIPPAGQSVIVTFIGGKFDEKCAKAKELRVHRNLHFILPLQGANKHNFNCRLPGHARRHPHHHRSCEVGLLDTHRLTASSIKGRMNEPGNSP